VIDFKHYKAAWLGVVLATGLALLLDIILWQGVSEAVRSESFATTQGVITRSEIEPGHKGAVDYEVEYRYTVNGVPYTATEYHVQPQFVQNAYWHAARDANPVGKAVTVYYDPDDPATAYLAPGLRSDMLFVAWLATGVTLLALGLWLNALEYLLGQRAFDPSLRRCVRRMDDGWVARPDPTNRFVVVFFIVLLITFFAGCFVALIYAVVFDSPPPWAVPVAMYVAAPVIAVLCARSWSREGLLFVNEREGTVEFAHSCERVTVPRGRLSPDVETEERKDSDGKPFEVFHVSLRWKDESGREQSAKLAEYADRADAEVLVVWLRECLALTAAPAPDSTTRS
jgi:hypothetical protein